MKKIIRFIFMFLLCLNLNVSSNKKDYSNYVTNDTVDMVNNYEELLMNSPNEIYQDGYYAGVYFKNLLNNFPLNSHGTCNFVALSMLLSFYDTYWFDNVVPEVYERNTVISTNNLPMSMSTYSPGVNYENESVKSILDLGEYQNYIYSTRNTYFQSLLIYLALMNGYTSISNSFSMNYYSLVAFINFYLNLYNQNTKNRFQIVTSVSEGVAPLIFASRMAAQGIPTLLRVGNSLTGKGHTVIAYDNMNYNLFVHTGWKKNGTALSHVSIDYLNYDTYGNYKLYISEYTDEDNDGDEELTKIVDVIGGDNPLLSELDATETFMEKVPIYFDHTVRKFAFTLQYTGDTSIMTNTIGQIAINKMVFYNVDSRGILPLSGYELDYEPEKWNNTLSKVDSSTYIYEKTNCYTYALNAPYHLSGEGHLDLWFENPGYTKHSPLFYDFNYTDKNEVIEYLLSDAETYGFTIVPINKFEICPIGMYKIAFLSDTNWDDDFHFYRQNSDGTWSHKSNGTVVRNFDFLNVEVIDPDEASNDHYNKLISYFAITPINTFDLNEEV